MKPERAIICANDLGEGPLWSNRESALYWLDINNSNIQRYFPKTQKYEVFQLPLKVTALALRKSGGFACATEKGFHSWDPANNRMEFIHDPEAGKAGARFNDGKVDRKGRFWAGTMTFEGASSALYRLDPDLKVTRMESNITISNGIGWSPDNSRMYYVDSLRYSIYVYDFDLESGEISNRHTLVQVEPSFGVPDGLIVDSQGCIWCAFYDGWKVVRYDPLGKEMERVEFPVARPTCPAFGGEGMDELYVTTAIDGLSADQLKEQPMAGDLFVIHTDVKGLPEPEFVG